MPARQARLCVSLAYPLVTNHQGIGRVLPARAAELFSQPVYFTANIDVLVLQGSKVIEVKAAGVNKGTAAAGWISGRDFDLIVAIGDEWTDEDLFAALPPDAYSLTGGMVQS